MRKRMMLIPLFVLAVFAGGAAPSEAPVMERTIDIEWTVEGSGFPEGTKVAELWIALPQELQEQEVSDLRVECEYPWEIVVDGEFGNRVVMITAREPAGTVRARLSARVIRRAVDGPRPAALSDRERDLEADGRPAGVVTRTLTYTMK
ncbi:MAG: hypothetical protein ABIK65_15655 [Candidatus Eisenbacteria bacterium]